MKTDTSQTLPLCAYYGTNVRFNGDRVVAVTASLE